jgi:CheY-like chemotaxis protein
MKRILWVDDDLYGTMMYLSDEMMYKGYEILKAVSVEECLKLLGEYGRASDSRADPDVVILDMIMPLSQTAIPGWTREAAASESDLDNARQTGYRLLKEIEKTLPNVPVVVLTHLQPTSAIGKKVFADLEADQQVMKPILLKPKTLDELVRAVETARAVEKT